MTDGLRHWSQLDWHELDWRDMLRSVTLRGFDAALLISLLALLMLGYVAMGSASIEIADTQYGNPFHHVTRHGVYLLIALTLGLITYQLPTQLLRENGGWMLLLSFALLASVLLFGKEVNGSKRWLALGPLTLQVSELVKLFVLIYVAGYLVRKQDELRTHWVGFIKPMLVMAFLIVLLLAEPDFGAAVVMTASVMGMLFLGGARLWQFLALSAVSLAAAATMVMTSEYRMKRLLSYTDPWANQFDGGYQLVQSLIAFGRGEWFGVGLGNSVQKLSYLPEAHTDFVVAILAEELGAVGVLLVLMLFSVLVGRMLWIARHSQAAGLLFGAYVAFGAAFLIAFQVFINLGVNTGLLPTKGLTLPFFSYGGSSLISCVVLVVLVARVKLQLDQLSLNNAHVCGSEDTHPREIGVFHANNAQGGE
jgi:cell division protein FtsW